MADYFDGQWHAYECSCMIILDLCGNRHKRLHIVLSCAQRENSKVKMKAKQKITPVGFTWNNHRRLPILYGGLVLGDFPQPAQHQTRSHCVWETVGRPAGCRNALNFCRTVGAGGLMTRRVPLLDLELHPQPWQHSGARASSRLSAWYIHHAKLPSLYF